LAVKKSIKGKEQPGAIPSTGSSAVGSLFLPDVGAGTLLLIFWVACCLARCGAGQGVQCSSKLKDAEMRFLGGYNEASE